MEPTETPLIPSWQRWPPNCCETCVGWKQNSQYTGECTQNLSVNCGDITDSRFRCQDFQRKPDAIPPRPPVQ